MTARVTRQDIETGLAAVGLRRGDIVLLHSSVASLGFVEGGAETIVEAFLGVLGPEGTLVVPTFGALGAVPDLVKARPAAVPSIHPLASVAAVGKDAGEICQDHWKAELAHGPDTPYTRIAAKGGYVCLLGVDQDRNTTLHTAEELLRLPYLRRTGTVTFATPEGEVTRSWPLFPGPHRDFVGLDRALRASGRMQTGVIGQAVVRLIRSADLIEIARSTGAQDPAFALCDNPNCADCAAQRAALLRHRWSQEPFQLIAAASLAGRYAEEVADACAAAGIGAVELDCLKGRPLARVPADERDRALSTLRGSGCEITALRLPCVPGQPDSLLRWAVHAGVERVVLPLSGDAATFTAQAHRLGLSVSFVNVAMDSATASRLLLGLGAPGAKAGFTFNAANFARCGEHPFGDSYKQKLRRFVDQLDLEDATADGQPQPLAHGHAEIKEMVSILRCAGFQGFLSLAAGNRFTGSLQDAVQRFAGLLDRM